MLMGNLYNALKKYFETTPKEELDEFWDSVSCLNDIEPSVKEWCSPKFNTSIKVDKCWCRLNKYKHD